MAEAAAEVEQSAGGKAAVSHTQSNDSFVLLEGPWAVPSTFLNTDLLMSYLFQKLWQEEARLKSLLKSQF